MSSLKAGGVFLCHTVLGIGLRPVTCSDCVTRERETLDIRQEKHWTLDPMPYHTNITTSTIDALAMSGILKVLMLLHFVKCNYLHTHNTCKNWEHDLVYTTGGNSEGK